MKQLHAIVHGKVQGVWFRAWTRDAANEMGVTGWVRNLADGSVETVSQGEKALLQAFLDRLHDGPPLARVTQVETQWQEVDEFFAAFKVRR